ncbi:MAG TPA: hypothetical protein DCY55_07590 [Gammaproteobacteria bacterium]|nr:hypothetical protein [Gammaproteobacteria bacterium]
MDTENQNVAIVDDEPLAASRLSRMVNDLAGYETVGIANSHGQALDLVKRTNPDILLLDIEMPGANGLQLASDLSGLKETAPAIIFCTAYDQYAIDAFTTQASGYLLKPVKISDLELALLKITKSKQNHVQGAEPAILPDEIFVIASEQSDAVRLCLSDVTYFNAENKLVFAHSHIKTDNGITENITTVDQSLDQPQATYGDKFIRAHRSTLVSARHIKRLFRDGTGKYWITVGDIETLIAISRRKIAAIKASFK